MSGEPGQPPRRGEASRHLGARPLIPLPGPEEHLSDPDTVATWHQALSSSLRVDVPHDLLAIWLYPTGGGVELLGPAELAADDLAVPLPAPRVSQDQLFMLEEVIRDAGYKSAVGLPIRSGSADVGLLLLADLGAAQYGPSQAILLQDVANRLAPTFARLARRPRGGDHARGNTVRDPAGETPSPPTAALVDALRAAAVEARTPLEYCRLLSAKLAPLLPHDRLHLLVVGPSPGQHYRIGEHADAPPWSDTRLVIEREALDLSTLFGGADSLLIADTRLDHRWPRSRSGAVALGQTDLRSLAGMPLELAGQTIGFLLLGSAGTGLYGQADAALLRLAGPLVAGRADGFLQAWRVEQLQRQLGTAQVIPARLRALAAVLASAPTVGESLDEFAAEATTILPFQRIRFALRLSESDRVAFLAPGEPRALADLPQMPVGGSALGRVIAGEVPTAGVERAGEIDLIFPLRTGGKITGAMVLTASGPDAFSPAHQTLAQQVADLVAPHLELLRRSALPPQVAPGWRRAPKF